MQIVYQGIPGSYSHQASREIAEQLGRGALDMTGFSQFDDVWQAINTETVAVLPIENSYAGSVHTNMYRFLRYEYRIYHAYDFAVHHCLLSTATDPTTITQVYSHWQALEQCYSYCAAHDYQQMPYGDTAGAAEMVAEAQNPSYGAIASSLAAELYGLQVLDQQIQDNPNNTTRFFVIAPQETGLALPLRHEKVVLLFSVRNGQGILYICLGAFATHGIDLSKIESLPSHQDPFTYMFWVECFGNPADAVFQEMLQELTFILKKSEYLEVFRLAMSLLMLIKDLYQRCFVPPHIQEHMYMVGAVAAALAAALPSPYQETLDKQLLLLVCLTHDFAKFVYLDLSYQPELREKEGLAYWQDKQRELQQTYGTGEYLAVQGMLRAAGLDEATLQAIHSQISTKLSELLEAGELLSYLYIYADMGVNWTQLTPRQTRIELSLERMHEKTPAEKIAAQQYLSSCAQRAESYLQEIYQQSPFEIAHAGWGEWYERMEYAVVGL